METSTLRWILIIAGFAIIGAIFLFGKPGRKGVPKASRRRPEEIQNSRERREPTLHGPPEGEDPMAELEHGDQGELAIGEDTEEQAEQPAPVRRAPAGPPPEKIVTLFLLAQDNRVITGAELLQATVSTGMEFGDMNIFHRLTDGEEKPVFSLANAAKPGHFNRDEWNTFETGGVALFMALPGPLQALDAWDSMLAAARRCSEILYADLLDDERNPFTRQREAQIREEMREYDRRNKPAG
ncbi:MAG: cell division protein ZipA [Lysobacterales bacterium]